MLAIHKHPLFRLICFFLLPTVAARNIFQLNETNSTASLPDEVKSLIINQTVDEDLTTLDHYFFSYDIIDHITILIKFDMTRTTLFRQSQLRYNAHVQISQLPSTNYRIDIGPFTGYYEKEIHGSITDHFTFCLILIPNRRQNLTKTVSIGNKTKTIYNDFLMGSSRNHRHQQQYIIHYCTRMGPDEDRHRHHIKQGTEGDRILLVLQLMMIGIILAILQIAHVIRDRKYKKWHIRRLNRIRRELLHRKEYIDMPNETLAMLRFATIIDKESHGEIDDPEREDEKEVNDEDEEEEEEERKENEDSSLLYHRRLPTRRLTYQHSRSPSPNANELLIYEDMSSVEHILQSKPWRQTIH
ncbi:hypothetical protein I4U23_028467 [Adineta vaga]|nr:hypothetical protein I4U23_028467 [Adineta vaga]